MSQVVYESRFPEIILALPEVLDAALAVGAQAVEQAARDRAPVRSGKLRDAIHTDRKGHAEYEVVMGDDEAWYGRLVEFGTSHSAAQPFAVPALEERKDEIITAVEVELHRL